MAEGTLQAVTDRRWHRIPLPEYEEEDSYLPSKDDASLDFYEACAVGDVEELASYIGEEHPDMRDLQYGLEHAAFAGNLATIRYLLEHGVRLHRNAFHRSLSMTQTAGRPKSQMIFQQSAARVIQILELYLEFGWHPNQPWTDAGSGSRDVFILECGPVLKEKTLVEWLLNHGADLTTRTPIPLVDLAASGHQVEVLDLLLSHGACVTEARPLHRLAVIHGGRFGSRTVPSGPDPFGRFKTAEWCLNHGVDIDAVANVKDRCLIPIGMAEVPATALGLACAVLDFEYAEWLFDHGADPDTARQIGPKLFGIFSKEAMDQYVKFAQDLCTRRDSKRTDEASADETSPQQ